MVILLRFKIGDVKKIFMICNFQSLVYDLKDNEKKNLPLNKDLNETFISCGTIIEMRPFMKIEEVAELVKDNIKYHFRSKKC